MGKYYLRVMKYYVRNAGVLVGDTLIISTEVHARHLHGIRAGETQNGCRD